MIAYPELVRVQVGELAIVYRHAGEGSPLVLLHGFLCDSRCWRHQLDDLSDQFSVFAWDAPGAGASSDPPETFTLTDWATLCAQFLDVVGIERAIILGLSWGGLLAQEFYHLYPTRVSGLILAGSYAGWKGSLGASVAEQRLTRCWRESSLLPNEFVARWVPVEFFSEDVSEELSNEMAAVVSDFHPKGFRLMAQALADSDTSNLLPNINVPTLLLWGDKDRRSRLSVAEQFRSAIPNAELAILANAGHVSNMEQPREFNAQVRRFIESASKSNVSARISQEIS